MKHWIFNKELGFPQCPTCKRWIHVYQGDAMMNYCPNCGERLDALRINDMNKLVTDICRKHIAKERIKNGVQEICRKSKWALPEHDEDFNRNV